MRISDWSSDVCSSDLRQLQAGGIDSLDGRERRHVQAITMRAVDLGYQATVRQRWHVAFAERAGRRALGQQQLKRGEPIANPVSYPFIALGLWHRPDRESKRLNSSH